MLDTPGKDGVTLRDKHNKTWEDTGVQPRTLVEQPEQLQGLEHVYNWFWALHKRRRKDSVGMAGAMPAPLSYCEILAWSSLMQQPISVLEVQAITRLDDVFMDHAYDKTETTKVSINSK